MEILLAIAALATIFGVIWNVTHDNPNPDANIQAEDVTVQKNAVYGGENTIQNGYITNNFYGSEYDARLKKSSNDSGIEAVDEWLVGYGDNGGNSKGRPEYTLQQINDGELGDRITFNSIEDSTIGHEFNFVGARKDCQNPTPEDKLWNGNVIQAENGETYRVRLYIHNNSPLGYEAIAKNVSVQYLISDPIWVRKNDISLDNFDSSNGYFGISVYGFIDSSNAVPSSYWDGVKFVSNKPFKLKYVPGTALLENNGIGDPSKYGPYVLSDDVVTEKGVLIGYDKLDGNIPGCYEYSAVVTIAVVPVFDE